MNLAQTFDGLALARNEAIELAPLVAPTLANIWAEFPELTPWTKDENGLLKPFYPRYTQLGQVLVLGLNPSYTAKDRDETDYDVAFDGKCHPYFRRISGFGRQVTASYEQLFQAPSYSPSEQAYHFGKLGWGHLDLLYLRATSQKALEKQAWNTPGAASFVWQQLQLTKRLLAALQPVAIVIANRFGQRLTGYHRDARTGANEWMGLQFTAEPVVLGAYRITGSTTNGMTDPDGAFGLLNTPVFFTGSFAGTSPRSKETDKLLIDSIAETCLREGTRYFEQYHLK